MICYKSLYGYIKGDDGKPEIVPGEAEVVREIYRLFLTGESIRSIKDTLEKRNIPSPQEGGIWAHHTISYILRNEKYKGDVITQKTYCPDFISHKRVKNTGHVEQHYITGHHEGIVDREIFDKVQSEFARRNSKKKMSVVDPNNPSRSRYSSKYALTDLLVCGICGAPYRR